jgi:hypothetical protein
MQMGLDHKFASLKKPVICFTSKLKIMKRLPIITSVESKLRFPGKDIDEDSRPGIFSYRDWINNQNKPVEFLKSYEPVAATSRVVGLSGYVQIGFSGTENGRMYHLKVPLQTSFLATYVQCPGGFRQMAMAVSLS